MPEEAWNRWGWIWLGVLFVLAALLVTRVILEPTPPMIDTRVSSGVHLTFVVIAPTGFPSSEYVEAVKAARTAYKGAAIEAGCFFSTVGISQGWYPDEGLAVLGRFGHFDELIVGRSWFNSGVQRYVTDLESVLQLPQVLAVVEGISVGETWWESTGPQEIGRHVGESALSAWLEEGSPTTVDTKKCQEIFTEGIK